MKASARATASTTGSPWARRAQMAAERTHPAPWLSRARIRGRRNSWSSPPQKRRSTTSSSSPGRCPPLRSTAGPSFPSARAASRASSRSRMGLPARTPASGTLGVITAARGMSSSRRRATALSARSRAPDLATITGSTTRGNRCSAALRATAPTIPSLASIPVLAASTPMSSTTASICSATKSGASSRTALTSRVFWAVRAVMALIPKQPRASKVLRSAWMPAPPPESLPAMVRHRGGLIVQAPLR